MPLLEIRPSQILGHSPDRIMCPRKVETFRTSGGKAAKPSAHRAAKLRKLPQIGGGAAGGRHEFILRIEFRKAILGT